MTKGDLKTLNADVLVAGGGLAGVCAALSAARNGATVILCHNRHVLGGNASSEIRMHIVGADVSGMRGRPLATEAREGGLMEEIRLESAARNPQCSPSMLDLILYEKCRAESNLTLLLNATVTGARMDGDRIVAARAIRPGTEDEFEISAKLFVDATGDGRLGVEAGALFRLGREGRDEYGEPHAQPQADLLHLGNTLLFMGRDMGRPMPFAAPPWARQFDEQALRLRPHDDFEYGYWWIEYGGLLDPIKDDEAIRDELMAVLMGVWDHIKNSGNHPESANWALDWIGFLAGKRESRRFIGLHVLKEQELQEAVRFGDAIAYGGWSFDTHPPGGVYAPDEEPCHQPYMPHLYEIPLSACISRNVRNLMFAGRNISASHIAFSSTRVMATSAAIGEGVGVFVALVTRRVRGMADLHEAHADAQLVEATRQQIVRQGGFIPGVRLVDPGVAASATVRVSSEQPNGVGALVLDGETRAVHGEWGVRPGLTVASTHRWMSRPDDKDPWLELAWGKPVDIGAVTLVFDSGMHRGLFPANTSQARRRMVWGPQPETIRDFDLLADDGDGLKTILEVRGNVQRQREFPLSLRGVRRLRLRVLATHGLDHARLFEIRCKPL
jgi:hypothetical protein